MKDKIEEVLLVIESSPRAAIAILATGAVPVLILLLGSFVLSRIQLVEPFSALALPVIQGYFRAITGIAGIAFLSLSVQARRHWVAARNRYFGRTHNHP